MPIKFPRIAAMPRPSLTSVSFAPLAAIMFTPLYAPLFANEQARPSAVTDPQEIDRAVAAFTGAPIGAIGGARAAADPRLRLAACAQPLTLSWHGTRRAAVKVECMLAANGSGPWQIFVATRTASTSANAPITARGSTQPAAIIVKRGDPITVMVKGRGFSVQQSGEALENGREGEWIAIRTNRRSEPVRAKIERPGLAIIPVS